MLNLAKLDICSIAHTEVAMIPIEKIQISFLFLVTCLIRRCQLLVLNLPNLLFLIALVSLCVLFLSLLTISH